MRRDDAIVPGRFATRAELSPDPRQWKICVVFPTKNQVETLEAVVQETRVAFAAHGLQPPVLLITDDSHDGTRELARRLGVYVVIGGGKGLGVAMGEGLRAALTLEPDVIVSADADGQSELGEIMRFLEPISADAADLVVGSRFLEPGFISYRYKWLNRFGIIILSGMLRRITKLPLTDSHGGLRAMRPEVVRTLDIIGTHTYVQETIIDAHEKGYRIKEVPSVWRPRAAGKSQVVGSVTKYIMYMLPILVIRAGGHVRWFYTAAFWLMTAAIAYFVLVFSQSQGDLTRLFARLPALVVISMMVMVGIQLFTLGFLTEFVGLIKLRVDRLASERRDTADAVRDAEALLR